MNIRNYLDNLTYDEIKALWKQHDNWTIANERRRGLPKWHEEEGTLNLMSVRCNSETDFNYGKYNDYLLMIYNKPQNEFARVLLTVTVDPATNKNNIAHLRQGMWNSYVVRPHRWASRTFPKIGYQSRWAICQDLHTVQVVRTNGKGEVISEERGMYGINIHDSGGYNDSSLGCTVIKSDDSYVDLFLPLIYDIVQKRKVPTNHDNLTYCLMNHSNLETYAGKLDKVEKADSVNGKDEISPSEPKGAIRV